MLHNNDLYMRLNNLYTMLPSKHAQSDLPHRGAPPLLSRRKLSAPTVFHSYDGPAGNLHSKSRESCYVRSLHLWIDVC